MKKILFLTTFLFLCFLSLSKAEAYSECNFSFVDKLPAEIPYTHSNGITYDSVIAVAGDTGSGSCSTTKYAIYVKSSASMPYFKEINQISLSLYFPASPVSRDQYVIYATSTDGGNTWSAFSSTLGNVVIYDLDGTQRVEYHFRSSKSLFFTSLYDYDFTSSGIPRFNLGYVVAGQEILTPVLSYGPMAPSGESIIAGLGEMANPENTISGFNEKSVSVSVDHESGLDQGLVRVRITDSTGAYVEKEGVISGADTGSTIISDMDASSLEDGDIIITSQVEDESGRLSDWSTGTEGLKDTTGPSDISGLLADPAVGEWTDKNDFEITWESSDDQLSDMGGYSYVLDRDSGTEPDDSVETSVENYSAEDLGSAENWYFHVRAVDSLGNLSETATIGPFKIDTKNPDLSHKKISEASAGEKITFEASVDDDGLSGMEEVRLFYKLGSDDWEDFEMNDSGGKKFRKSVEIPSNEEGNLKYFIMAVDSVGNKIYICDGGKTGSKSEAKEDPIKVEIIPITKSSEASSGDTSSLVGNIQKDFEAPISEVAGAETQNNNPSSSSGTRIIRGSDNGGGISEVSKILIFSIIGSILVMAVIIWMRVRAARKRKLAPATERNSYWDQLVK